MRVLVVAALLAACGGPTKMRVDLFPAAYSAAMSSTPGLGLTPVSEPPSGVTPRYRYTATEGYFVTWDESTHEVLIHGPEFVTLTGKVYWSYDAAIPTGRAGPVRLAVITENAKSGKPLARADINLAFDGELFRVQK
ncbi:MAG: hypothetical protein M0D55_11140 [Elusimicrobiota bacterium]|nr:MAG: hypothetical protein M0D55_11140 [Elusimicrobiota bacterium]